MGFDCILVAWPVKQRKVIDYVKYNWKTMEKFLIEFRIFHEHSPRNDSIEKVRVVYFDDANAMFYLFSIIWVGSISAVSRVRTAAGNRAY